MVCVSGHRENVLLPILDNHTGNCLLDDLIERHFISRGSLKGTGVEISSKYPNPNLLGVALEVSKKALIL
jgi:hypothetical protein